MSEMFTRKDTPTIMDGLVVRWQLTSELYDGEINASRNGVSLFGRWPIMDTESVVLFEETLARARVQAQHLSAERGMLFGPRIEALTDAEIDRILGPLPAYEDV
jgi:hypothetical protein